MRKQTTPGKCSRRLPDNDTAVSNDLQMRGVKSEDRKRCRPRRHAVYNVGGEVTARARALEGGPQDSVRKCEAGKKDRIAWLAIGSPPETPTNIVGSSQAGVLLILVYKARVKKNRKLVKDPQNVSRGR